MDKFAKRLQSRLSAKGYRFNKEDCRQALACTCANAELPTEEEMKRAFVRLVSLNPQPETQAIVPAQTEEIAQAQEPAPEIEEPEFEKSSLTTVQNQGQMAQAPVSGISQIEVSQAVNEAIVRLGIKGNEETVGILTQLVNQLTGEIDDLEQMITRVVALFLDKRQNILSSAIGTLDSLRSAQSSSFQAGIDSDFFERKNRNKQQFLSQIEAAFN